MDPSQAFFSKQESHDHAPLRAHQKVFLQMCYRSILPTYPILNLIFFNTQQWLDVGKSEVLEMFLESHNHNCVTYLNMVLVLFSKENQLRNDCDSPKTIAFLLFSVCINLCCVTHVVGYHDNTTNGIFSEKTCAKSFGVYLRGESTFHSVEVVFTWKKPKHNWGRIGLWVATNILLLCFFGKQSKNQPVVW